MNYAIVENGVVTNLAWLHPNNAKEFPNAVAVGNVPVWLGDTYEDGAFYRNGERVLSAEEIAIKESEDMKEALALLGVNVHE